MNRRLLTQFSIVLIATVVLIIPLCYGTAAGAEGNQPLIIGGSFDYPPYSFVDEDGQASGLASDLSKEIMKYNSQAFTFNLTSWPLALDNLQNDRVNLLQDVAYSEDRANIYDFSDPYYVAPYTVFMRKDCPEPDLKDLTDKTIIVVQGDIGHDYLVAHKITSHLILSSSYSEALIMLNSGQGDYVLMEKLPGLYWAEKCKLTNIRAGNMVLFEVSYCWAAKKGDPELIDSINKGLAELKYNGQYEMIYQKWMGIASSPAYQKYQKALEYLAVGFLALLCLFMAVLVWSWFLKRQVESRTNMLKAQNLELLDKEELLRDHEEELSMLNEELEKRVSERTRELEKVNTELESFSYSISHDLRGPLRAIDGFSRILLEDYADRLDSEGKRYIISISKNAVKMGQLIDDLLTFSKMSRMELAMDCIDMTHLVRSVFSEAVIREADRNIDFTVGELPPCVGNEPMVRQLWLNLLSNALKFSRKRNPAQINVGSTENEAGETVYFVCDNGEGFNMKYAGKLFTPFNRLHHFDEYEGTGVGLAIVKRVVDRHGGQIWPEASENQGACFYFTLPRPHYDH